MTAARATRTGKWPVKRWLRTVVLLLALVIIAWFVVVPEYSQARGGLWSLEHTSFLLVALAAVLEIGSLFAFSALTAVVVGRPRPSYFTLLRIDLTDLGVNHVVPGGGTTAAAVRLHLLRKVGVPASRAMTAATIEIVVSNLMLGVLFLVGVVLSVFSLAGNKYYTAAALIVAGLIIVASGTAWLLTNHTATLIQLVLSTARRFSQRHRVRASNFIKTMADELTAIRRAPKRMGAIALFALLNWLLDAAALWLVLIAFGYTLNPAGLLAAYGVASILSLVPITPGGVGIVEGVLVPSLVGFGVPGALALISVIGWRILEFWIPIPVSFVSYLTLRFGVLKETREDNSHRR